MSCLAAIGLHLGERHGLSLILTQVDRSFEFGKLGANALFQASKAVLLRGIVHREALQRIEARPNFPHRQVVGIEVAILTGEQIAPLSGLGVLYR